VFTAPLASAAVTIVRAGPTVTAAVVSGINGKTFAWMVAEPPATPVTRTDAEVVLARIVTVAGTVATAGLLELKFTVMSALKAAERIRLRNCEAPWLIFKLDGTKLRASVTSTDCEAGA